MPAAAERRLLALDVLGVLLFGGAAAWTFVAAPATNDAAWDVAGLYLACGAAVLLGRLIADFSRPLLPVAAVVVAGGLALVRRDEILSAAPLGGPFGYANATGAFYASAAIAGLMVAAGSRRWVVRVAGGAATAAAAVVTVASGSVAAAALLVLPFAALFLSRRASPRASVAAMGAIFVLALAGTTAAGALRHPAGPVNPVGPDSPVDRRLVLWHEALVLMREHPATGVGPGGFASESPSAVIDPDSRWAHHGFLQQGAEAGIPGLAFLVALFLWGFARLALASGADGVTVLAAAGLAALGVHACLDYVLHFAGVPLVAAGLVGAGIAPPARRPRANMGGTTGIERQQSMGAS
jgi:O-antigen ligase